MADLDSDSGAAIQDLDGFGDAGTPAGGAGGKESSHLRNIRELSALKEGLAASIKSKRAAALWRLRRSQWPCGSCALHVAVEVFASPPDEVLRPV